MARDIARISAVNPEDDKLNVIETKAISRDLTAMTLYHMENNRHENSIMHISS